jgi:hypothetical protein
MNDRPPIVILTTGILIGIMMAGIVWLLTGCCHIQHFNVIDTVPEDRYCIMSHDDAYDGGAGKPRCFEYKDDQ